MMLRIKIKINKTFEKFVLIDSLHKIGEEFFLKEVWSMSDLKNKN
jgi:hypothetical protein